jgi:hypothetical protein
MQTLERIRGEKSLTPSQIALSLLLAQTCVAEISFQKDASECIVMWEVNKRNATARGRTIRKQTLLFNSYWRSKPQRARRPWIGLLTADGRKPMRWPKRLSWKAHRPRWLRYVQAANQFVLGKLPEMCPQAVDYGAPYETPNSVYRARVNCLGGKTKQLYWRVTAGLRNKSRR